jgi:hypothetical protein
MKCALSALLLILALPLFGDTPPRNWGRCPAVVTLETNERVFALGDTHGDYDRLVRLLAAGKLIDGVPNAPDEVKWSGGRSILVVTGDMIDKGKQSLKVIALMRKLINLAPAQGGRIIISAGNHEAEFLANPNSSKTSEFQQELKAAGIKPSEVADGLDEGGIGKFLLCLPFASRVNSWFFAHAGSTNGRTLGKLSADLQKGLDEEGYDAKVLLGKKGLLEARMKPPWWEKDGDTPEQSIMRLLEHADAVGAKHIVFGHQPGNYTFNDGSTRKKGTMFQNFGGLVFLIDMGMSSGVDYSHGALLRITDDSAVAVFPDGTEKPLWPVP